MPDPYLSQFEALFEWMDINIFVMYVRQEKVIKNIDCILLW